MNIQFKPARLGQWMQTYSGRQFWPLDPQPHEVFIDDIAHALAHQCRYAGHCLRFYSVAEHSILLSRCVSEENKLWALLHDASEAYLSDVIRPIKPYLSGYKFREEKVMRAIAERFGLKGDEPAEVKAADDRITLDERAQNMHPTTHKGGWPDGKPLGVNLEFMSPQVAEQMFRSTFESLTT